MFDRRSSEKELLDHPIHDEHVLRQNLDEMELVNNWLGSKRSVINFIKKMSIKYHPIFKDNKISVADLGCGNGDLLRAIDDWSKKNKVKFALFGMDNNPSSIQYAAEKSNHYPDIQYKIVDILSEEFKHSHYDIICINSVCHHFDDDTLIRVFQQLANQARLAVFVNDLHRNRLSYFFIKWLSKLFNFSYLAKHDAPVSVLRAFHKNELIHLLEKANISNYEIHWAWAFRWEIIIWCKT